MRLPNCRNQAISLKCPAQGQMSVIEILQQSRIVLGDSVLLGEAITPQLQEWKNLVALDDATARDDATPLVNLSTGGYRGSIRLGW